MLEKIERRGRRVVIELDEFDCELICAALKLARQTRETARKLLGLIGHHEPETPAADAREDKLVALLTITNN